jgi:hypothetical protein
MDKEQQKREAGGKNMTRKIAMFVAIAVAMGGLLSCAHPMTEAKAKTMTKFSKEYKTDANQAYYAVRWALKTNGYAIANEDLQNGVITSGWLDSPVDGFYTEPFGHRDYGVNGAYYQLTINIVPQDGGMTKVEVTSSVKSVISHLQSSGKVEKKILKKISDYLRTSDVKVTNLGMEE